MSTVTGLRRVLLVGGTSEIGLAIVRRLSADRPLRPYLLGRDRTRLEQALATLATAGCLDGATGVLDAERPEEHRGPVEAAFREFGGFDLVVVAVGVLGGQQGLDADEAEALETLGVTFLGTGSLMMHCLRALRDQGRGTLVVLSSVAGERVRASNAVYGAAKAGLDALAQGLGDALADSGVRVLVVRPGFVTSRMTAGLPRAPMSASPEEVAEATVRGLATRAHTVWVPGRLRFVFAVLRHLPRGIWRRLPL